MFGETQDLLLLVHNLLLPVIHDSRQVARLIIGHALRIHRHLRRDGLVATTGRDVLREITNSWPMTAACTHEEWLGLLSGIELRHVSVLDRIRTYWAGTTRVIVQSWLCVYNCIVLAKVAEHGRPTTHQKGTQGVTLPHSWMNLLVLVDHLREWDTLMLHHWFIETTIAHMLRVIGKSLVSKCSSVKRDTHSI